MTPTETSVRSKSGERGGAATISSTSPDQARFLPGKMLAGRYRIHGLLGRGGMGEVYRADDLKLGQSVALKFLPQALEKDPGRLNRFLNEVKLARQVSHPNVCRVYDVGEVDGQHFLSMEYVDGEDLASLLRRIGRLPEDKAVQIARQLCAGLAAAHEQRILHRDLKPANVMIDGRGRAKITDFGLAGLAEAIEEADLAAGTPGYMAPEQLSGEEVTIKSDLYALGLVLYELFTGTPAFRAGTPAELAKLQQESTPTRPSSHVEGLDPTVERLVLRCLEKDPQRRPPSALTMAAALPGGDPLAAALAAGETPSPEMVAAGGEEGKLHPAVGLTCLAAIVFGVILVALLSEKLALFRKVPLDTPPEVLAHRAQEIIVKLGYTRPSADSAFGFRPYSGYLGYLEENDPSATRWDRLASGRPTAVFFWYRQSPRPLVPVEEMKVTYGDPPFLGLGIVRVLLDLKGRLVAFHAVPPEVDEGDGPWPVPDWAVLFQEAGLDMASFTPTDSRWIPPVHSDVRAAWKGVWSGEPEIPIRIEASAYRGRPLEFWIVEPWDTPELLQPEPRSFGQTALSAVGAVTGFAVLLGAGFLARRNLRQGRGDKKGAFRLAVYISAVGALTGILYSSHIPEGERLFRGLAVSLAIGGFAWLFYIALEPYLRRLWPERIVSWSRLLAGRFRDPLVGRDLLIGGVVGVAFVLLEQLRSFVVVWFGSAPPRPSEGGFNTLLGGRRLLAQFFEIQPWGVGMSMFMLLLFLFLRVILRKTWLAAGVFILFYVSQHLRWHAPEIDQLLLRGVQAGLLVFLLVRLGLLATVATFTVHSFLLYYPITLDFSTWYATSSIFPLAVIGLLAAYGFYTSLGGRPLFRGDLLRE